MQVDYGEGAPTRVPGTDRYRKPRLFVATLRDSRASFRLVVWKSGQQELAKLHEQARRYFGGSYRHLVLDNLKEGVFKPDLYEPELNPVYAATLAHYEVVADPARVRDHYGMLSAITAERCPGWRGIRTRAGRAARHRGAASPRAVVQPLARDTLHPATG